MNFKETSKIKRKVLEEVKPSEKEIRESLDQFKKIQKFIRERFNLKSELMGSVAKRTFLKGDKDLDIFIFFSKETSKEKLKDRGLEVGKEVFKRFKGNYEVDYAEHPYTKGYIDKFRIEIVPCYELDNAENIVSSVDRTPFHTKWVNEHLDERGREEVLVLKAFLKGIGVYGSSLKTEGFSGYLCELLIAQYKSFESLIKKAKDWEYGEKLDLEGYYAGEIPAKLQKKFEKDCFIVIDPVDKERNVASVLSEENYAKFVFNAWRFYKNPSLEFFFPKEKEVRIGRIKKEIEKRGTMLVVEFEKPKVIEDILYPQLRRALKRIMSELKENEFELFESGIFVGKEKIRFLFDFKVEELPKAIKHVGPKVYHDEVHLEQFLSKYKNVWIEQNRLVTIVDRKFSKARDLLKEFLEGPQEELESKGIPDHIAKAIQSFEIKPIDFNENKRKEWLEFLRDFLKI